MFSDRQHNLRFQKITRLVAAWFIFFAIVVPAIHRHGDYASSVAKISANAKTIVHNHGHLPTDAARSGARLISQADDDCAICQWFSVGFAPTSAEIFLIVTAALALLALSVRLLALCQRPLPRRGLRAPPALFA